MATKQKGILKRVLKQLRHYKLALALTILCAVVTVAGTLGFDYAQVTRGGIEADGVTDSLESKFVKNLFFAGEMLDVDGDCGGYNLQWAFTSGIFVADEILKRL